MYKEFITNEYTNDEIKEVADIIRNMNNGIKMLNSFVENPTFLTTSLTYLYSSSEMSNDLDVVLYFENIAESLIRFSSLIKNDYNDEENAMINILSITINRIIEIKDLTRLVSTLIALISDYYRNINHKED